MTKDYLNALRRDGAARSSRGGCSPAWLSVLVAVSILVLAPPMEVGAQPRVYAKDGSGVYGYKDTPKLPWCDYLVHDPDRPAPKKVDPGPPPPPSPVPADAIILFDGKDLSQWETRGPEWKIVDGCIESAGATNLVTRQSFGNCQIHLEWMDPTAPERSWYNRGNNGVMLMGVYEIQIFDSYNEKIYPDGQAGAIYGQTPPLVNACRKPGEWQSYDILFTAPVFDGEKLVSPPRVTLFHNGLLAQWNQEIYGETDHRKLPAFHQKTSRGPLSLAAHNCPVRFRNIWLRPL